MVYKSEMLTDEMLTDELKLIIDYLTDFNKIKTIRNFNHIGVLSGVSGILVVLLDIYKNKPSPDLKSKIQSVFDKILEILHSSDSLMITYCDGLAGLGILLSKMIKSDFYVIKDDDFNTVNDILNQIDEIAEEEIIGFVLQENFDFLHGLVGLGFYFVERENEIIISRIVEYLRKKATITESEVYWVKYDQYHNHTSVIDLGVAHGNASVILLLTKIGNRFGIDVKELIYGNIKFYLNNLQNLNENVISFYPTVLIHSKYLEESIQPSNSRLAWCYGDLGSLYILFLVAKELNLEKESSVFLERLLFVSKRNKETDDYEMDAAFCHGSSGIATIFYKLSQLTNLQEFMDAAYYWLRDTLDSKNTEENKIKELGYSFPIKDSEEHNISLLEGATGLIYCYGKFLSYDCSLTDEFLLLKI